MGTPPHHRRVRFGAFDVDLRSGELYKNGVRLKLQDQPFQVLALLVEHSGDVVTREELRQKLWPVDTFVGFDTGLNSAVKKLRDALNDKAETPRYVETLPRRGYRLIVPVENVESPGVLPQGNMAPPSVPQIAEPTLPATQGEPLRGEEEAQGHIVTVPDRSPQSTDPKTAVSALAQSGTGSGFPSSLSRRFVVAASSESGLVYDRRASVQEPELGTE